MHPNRLIERTIHWILPRLRIGEYHRSVSGSLKKNVLVLERYESEGAASSNRNDKNIFFARKFQEKYQKCYKYGGYIKVFSKYFWSHKKIKYFDFDKNIWGGLPQFITEARLVNLKNVEYNPHRWKPNLNQKYTFYTIPSSTAIYDIEKAFSFNIGMVEWFQHFIQDCLPLVNRARLFLIENPDVKLLFPKASEAFRNRSFFLKQLGIFNKVVETDVNDCFIIKDLYFWDFTPYNAKFIAPVEWHNSLRSYFNESSQNFKKRTMILLIRSEKTRNLVELNFLCTLLKQTAKKTGLVFKIIDTSFVKFDDYLEDIRNSKVILGVHGGASFNILFAPEDSHFFEIIPMFGTDSVIHFASGIGAKYHPIPVDFDKSDSKVSLSNQVVKDLIREIQIVV